jgi:hypothetical protein
LLDKLEVALSDENRSHQIEKECEDEKEKENSDRQEITRPVNRYFSDVNSFDVMNKGVCSRCKKVTKSKFIFSRDILKNGVRRNPKINCNANFVWAIISK